MKNKKTLPLFVAIVALMPFTSLRADDLQALCNSLKQETVSTPPVASRTSNAASPKKSTPRPSVAHTQASQPKNVILSPKDKFPPQVTGMYVAGNFMPKYLQDDGLVLVAAEDFMNPFARQFIVANVRTGVGPGQIVPVSNPHLVQVSPSRPLVIISRGIVPGTYIVNTQ
jgi:hypothetical protein